MRIILKIIECVSALTPVVFMLLYWVERERLNQPAYGIGLFLVLMCLAMLGIWHDQHERKPKEKRQ
jgi:hypothetical protein